MEKSAGRLAAGQPPPHLGALGQQADVAGGAIAAVRQAADPGEPQTAAEKSSADSATGGAERGRRSATAELDQQSLTGLDEEAALLKDLLELERLERERLEAERQLGAERAEAEKLEMEALELELAKQRRGSRRSAAAVADPSPLPPPRSRLAAAVEAKDASPLPPPRSRLAAAVEAKVKGHEDLQAGRFEAAAHHFEEAFAFDPTDMITSGLAELAYLQAWEARGIPVMRLDSFAAAKELVQQYEKPGAEAKAAGIAAFLQGDLQSATQGFLETLRLDPGDDVAMRLLEATKLREWEARGLPAMRLGTFRSAQQLAERFELVEEMTPGELTEWYEAAGLPKEADLEEHDMSDLLKKVTTWQALPLPELQADYARLKGPVAAADGGPGDGERQRPQLAKQLLLQAKMEAWDSKGYEARRIRDVYAVIQVVEECEQIKSTSFDDLLLWYRGLGFPEEAGMAREEIARLMKSVTIWRALPVEELERECSKHGLPGDAAGDSNEGIPGDSSHDHHQVLTERLLIHERMLSWESKGYQAQRIGDADAVAQVVAQHTRIGQMSQEELLKWYQDCGFPGEDGLEDADLAEFFKRMTMWNALPLAELIAECSKYEVSAAPQIEHLAAEERESKKMQLLDKLLIQDRMLAWQKKGFRSMEIGDADKVIQVIRQQALVEQMDLAELLEWYTDLGMPSEKDLEQAELAKLAKDMVLWEALSMACLKDECRRKGLRPERAEAAALAAASGGGADGSGGDGKERQDLMQQLLLNERMKAWDDRGFCTQRIGKDEHVLQAVENFEHFRSMGDAELRTAHASAGLPPCGAAGALGELGREELLRNIKKAIVWELLPFSEVQRECEAHSLSSQTRRGDTDQRREELLHRLKVDMRVSAALGSGAGYVSSAAAAFGDGEASDPQLGEQRSSTASGAEPPAGLGGPSAFRPPERVDGADPLPDRPPLPKGAAREEMPDMMDWYEEADATGGGADSDTGGPSSQLARLEAWLASGACVAEDLPLLSKLVDRLRSQGFAMGDLPNDAAEHRAFLEELGFGALERTKLKRALREFHLRA